MKTETNKTFTFARGAAAVCGDTGFLRRAARRRDSLTPICPRPLSRHDLRSFRRAETRLLMAIQGGATAATPNSEPVSWGYTGQRREFVLLLLYAAALLLMIGAA